ncbi:MAG: CsbD family protein [Gemmatimonadales bacterium]
MTWDQIKGNWKQFRGSAKEQWGKLTDDDLDRIEGKREQLEGAIQTRYGKTREMVKEEVDRWADEMKAAR